MGVFLGTVAAPKGGNEPRNREQLRQSRGIGIFCGHLISFVHPHSLAAYRISR